MNKFAQSTGDHSAAIWYDAPADGGGNDSNVIFDSVRLPLVI